MPRTVARRFLVSAVALLAAACTTQKVRPIPDPLPEVLEWASGGQGGGSFLGLKTRENTSDTLDDLAFQPGVHVRSVVENSPAEAAGFRIGDVVLAMGEHPIDDPATLARLVEASAPGNEVRMRVQRGDTVFEVPVVLGAGKAVSDEAEVLFRKDPVRSRAGWKGGRGGVVLVSSEADGPFPTAGIEVGSVVHSIEGEPVASAHGLIRRLALYEPGARVRVEYADVEGEPRSTRVELHDEPSRVTRLSIPVLASYGYDIERDRVSFTLVDLWILSLFRYEREGEEKRWSFLRFFQFQSDVGKLAE